MKKITKNKTCIRYKQKRTQDIDVLMTGGLSSYILTVNPSCEHSPSLASLA